jgi:diguanylate cyclase (GGDEF)-like protein
VVCATFLEVTEARQAEVRSSYLARHDDLTGLPNRNYFTEQLQALIDRRQVAGVLFFDLDRFKIVNDALGHHCGDLLLTAVGSRAQEVIAGRGFLARFGGDEYAVLAPDLGLDQLALLAESLITALTSPFVVDGHRVAVGASVGIALVNRRTADPTAPMREADLALNAAKETGGNAHKFFETSMGDSLKERGALEVAIWDALEREQFGVAYQPQVDLSTGELSGVEALVRWDHPTLGSMPPGQFVPVAEATGLIAAIGRQVLRRACREIAAASSTLRLAVNVSPVQFTRGDLVATITDALTESGLDPSRLEIEITESLFLNSGRLIEETMAQLKKLGVSFALDDFGTGYSSLSSLRQFPIGKIKIDRSFISGLPFDQESLCIVQAVAAMAKALNIGVNAEGIETKEQATLLRALGCDQGQGFLYGKAQPLPVLRNWLDSSSEAASLRRA